MNPENDAGHGRSGVSRRSFLGGGLVAAAVTPLLNATAEAEAAEAASATDGVAQVMVRAAVNGAPVTVLVDRGPRCSTRSASGSTSRARRRAATAASAAPAPCTSTGGGCCPA